MKPTNPLGLEDLVLFCHAKKLCYKIGVGPFVVYHERNILGGKEEFLNGVPEFLVRKLQKALNRFLIEFFKSPYSVPIVFLGLWT
jgi:hypothetical protein